VEILDQYKRIVSQIPIDSHKYIHSKSIENFISQIENMSEWDAIYVKNKLQEYLLKVESSIQDINSYNGLELFEEFIYPLGSYLKKYGLKRIMPNKYRYIFSLMTDFLLLIIFYPLFFPLATVVVMIYYLLWLKPIYRSKKVYGLFY
jgi:hypothetical protein